MYPNLAEQLQNTAVEISTVGDNIIVPSNGKAIFIYEIYGDTTASADVLFKAGTRVLSKLGVADAQGLTVTSIPNIPFEPRYICFPNEDFIINLSGAATFKGGVAWAYRI